MVNEKLMSTKHRGYQSRKHNASSVSVKEHNSLPSEEDSDSLPSKEDSDSLLSDITSFLSGSPNMGRDIIHFNPDNPFELSKIESSDNHNVSKELNAEVIEENISIIIGSPSMMGDSVHFNTENSSEMSELASLDNHIPGHLAARLGCAETKVATWDDLAFKLIILRWNVKRSTNIANFTRKQLKPEKHGHGNGIEYAKAGRMLSKVRIKQILQENHQKWANTDTRTEECARAGN
ncbi:hypothetical protein Tco_0996487 [Tanacetum coccineum]